MRHVFLKALAFCGALTLLANCGDGGDSFSLLPDGDVFEQSPGAVNDKIDIIWMVDNSGSMDSSQTNLVDNFNSFIQDFQTKGLNFKMAFTSSDAYKPLVSSTGSNCSPFRDGPLRWSSTSSNCVTISGASYSGFDILTPSTPNLAANFVINARQGISGSGDERAFSSVMASLNHSTSAGFLRPDSFLAVIIVSDEDDFSHNGSSSIAPNYSHANLHPVSQYVTALDTLTNSTGASRRYSVSSIAIFDTACRDFLNSSFSGRLIGQRYGQLSDATGGIKASLCGDFANELAIIADNILTLATQFYLSRLPIEETIVVKVNGATVPNVSSSPGHGWEYNSEANSIRFYGDAIPDAGSTIAVTFDPVAYGS